MKMNLIGLALEVLDSERSFRQGETLNVAMLYNVGTTNLGICWNWVTPVN